MNRILISLIWLTLLCIHDIHGQQYYHGLPVDQPILDSSDVIMVDVPYNMSARFIKSNGLDNLISFLKGNDSLTLEIQIHDFFVSKRNSMRYSNVLAENLRNKLLKHEISNVQVYGKGSENPIFLDETAKGYKSINTRLEIHILGKSGMGFKGK
jgi:hypothetical protein